MQVAYELSACVDCLFYVANGSIPEDRPSLPNDIKSQWGELSHGLHAACDELGFSWTACECCGSVLGGSREKLIILQP